MGSEMCIRDRGRAIHVNRCDMETFLLLRAMVVKKLGDLNDPIDNVDVVEVGNLKLHVRAITLRWRGFWDSFHVGVMMERFHGFQTIKDIIEFGMEGALVIGQR